MRKNYRISEIEKYLRGGQYNEKSSIYAEDDAKNTVEISGDAQVLTTGLIYLYDLSVPNSNGQLCINGYTCAVTAMKSVGFKNIQIEQSSDNSTWNPYNYNIDDVLSLRTYTCSITNFKISVTKGYYYRVTCTHYAKESGLFGSSQSVSNTSNSVWIS